MQTMTIIRRRIQYASILLLGIFSLQVNTFARDEDQVAAQLCEILYQGRLAQGEVELQAKLAANTKAQAVRASLGIVQFIKAVETLSQDYYRFGMEPQRVISIGNMLVQRTGNPNPEPISFADARGILERFEQRLTKAEKTLSEFSFSGIKLPIDVTRIYLDLDNDGKMTGNVPLWSINQIADLIAFIHVINFEVIEPKRMAAALGHFEQVIALSRTTWKWIREETDNDREWLPGPTQNSVVLADRVGGPLGANWEKVLDRTELVLQGKELIPFWRGYAGGNALVFFNNSSNMKFHPELGVNLRKVFTQPKRFDLVLWIQGTGAAPFLEKGNTIDLQAWQDLSQSFGGRLPFFSFWIN